MNPLNYSAFNLNSEWQQASSDDENVFFDSSPLSSDMSFSSNAAEELLTQTNYCDAGHVISLTNQEINPQNLFESSTFHPSKIKQLVEVPNQSISPSPVKSIQAERISSIDSTKSKASTKSNSNKSLKKIKKAPKSATLQTTLSDQSDQKVTDKARVTIKTQQKQLRTEKRQEQSRQASQKYRDRKRREFDLLESEHYKTVELGKKVETFVDQYRQFNPTTNLQALKPDVDPHDRIYDVVNTLFFETMGAQQATRDIQTEMNVLQQRLQALEQENFLLKKDFATIYLSDSFY